MSKITGIFLIGLTGLTGLALLFVKTDREFINLTPTAGQSSVVVLEEGHTYTQTFPVRRNTAISRVGLFLRPATAHVASGAISLSLEGEGGSVTKEISTEFIDKEGTTQIRFLPAVPVTSGAEIKLTLRVPKNTSGQISAQAPLAYQVYYREHPALALQIGGLCLLAAVLTIIPPRWWQWVKSSSLGRFLDWLNLTTPAVLLGVIIFAFTPIWPLNILGILAALALNSFHRFLGQDRLIASLMYTIDILVLLELFHVAA